MKIFIFYIIIILFLQGCLSDNKILIKKAKITISERCLKNDDLLFCIDFSEGCFIGAKGGNVEGVYKKTSGNFTFKNSDTDERYLNIAGIGKDSLSFYSAGNILYNQGYLMIRQAYSFDPISVSFELQKSKKRSKRFYLFSSANSHNKTLFFYEVFKNSRITFNCAIYKKQKWKYFYFTLDTNKYKPDTPFNISFSWGNNQIRFIIDDHCVVKKKFNFESWGKCFFIGSFNGNHPFDGKIYSVNIYRTTNKFISINSNERTYNEN